MAIDGGDCLYDELLPTSLANRVWLRLPIFLLLLLLPIFVLLLLLVYVILLTGCSWTILNKMMSTSTTCGLA